MARIRALMRAKYAAEAARGGDAAQMARSAAESETYTPGRATLDVIGPEGYERTVAPAPRYSRAATQRQAEHLDLMASHPGPAEDLSSLASHEPGAGQLDPGLSGYKGLSDTLPSTPPQVKDFAERQARGAYSDLEHQSQRATGPIREKLRQNLRERAVQERTARKSAEDEALAKTQEDLVRSRRGYGSHGALSQRLREQKFLDAFEKQYGWRPKTASEGAQMMSPAQLEELGFPEFE